jgi:lipopolysaccharide transport system ATP-binding protein
MTDLAIRVENLGKLYHIGPRERYKTLRDTVTDALYAPFRRLRSAFQPPSIPVGTPP